ncbi:hypothetical protein HPB50_001366 [Hyalomma asiaticum]|uniref:Uncharacterized protein n=1 Tax=Hyalomma asiaticum TaxID=266040 RepID=A0ACB7RUL7_HYAAI|nr:hypothetical protein HPB50_001366 [Hyalomma asiaticum]
MLKFAVFLLLCAALVSAGTPDPQGQSWDLFEGCVDIPKTEVEDMPGVCTLVPESEVHTDGALMQLAEAVMYKYSYRSKTRYLNTVSNITRAALQHTDTGLIVRLEFLTMQSNCLAAGAFSLLHCKPVSPKAN